MLGHPRASARMHLPIVKRVSLATAWTVCLMLDLGFPMATFASGAGVISTDVLVYGGTPAGVAAAIAASRQGQRVILLEPTSVIGGMMASGLGASDIGSKDAIGGIAREFFRRLGAAYKVPDNQPAWDMTPGVAARVFKAMLAEAHVQVATSQRLRRPNGVVVTGHRIQRMSTESGRTYAAHVFVDATYEGDLMADAGVSFVVGRESFGQYGESLAGVQAPQAELPVMAGTAANGKPVPGVSTGNVGAHGSADNRIQPYTFRLCVSADPAGQVPFPKPTGYDPARYVLVQRHLAALTAAGKTPALPSVLTIGPLPERKGDLNAAGPLSTDLLGGSDAYPTASYAARQAIWGEHYRYQAGLLYFLANDRSVPATVQTQLRKWGLCRDEFTATHHWPPLIYVREARRMVSDFVMTQPDLIDQRQKPDSIAVGAYRIDAHATRLVLGPRDRLEYEGLLSEPVGGRYDIPYRILVPRRSQILNLLDPVTVSASHVAFASLRVEPQYMAMGEAAGAAAALASASRSAVQDVDVAKLQAVLTSHAAVTRVGSVTSSANRPSGASARTSPPALTSGWFIAVMLMGLLAITLLAGIVWWRGRPQPLPIAASAPDSGRGGSRSARSSAPRSRQSGTRKSKADASNAARPRSRKRPGRSAPEGT